MKRVLMVATCIGVLVLGANFAYASVQQVPEPSTLILLGSGLAGLFFFRKMFKK